jgi:hypothetical protein
MVAHAFHTEKKYFHFTKYARASLFACSGLVMGKPTPYVGLTERISTYFYYLWQAIFIEHPITRANLRNADTNFNSPAKYAYATVIYARS